ncbi:MAG: hypothetical protein RLZZ08_29 [Pseudomonadota bacterium]|jgi:hypothetical protein
MKSFMWIVIIALMVMVVVSLVRGIIAFLATTKQDIENGSDRIHELQLMQNKMMFSRIKYQAMAIIALVLLMMMAR